MVWCMGAPGSLPATLLLDGVRLACHGMRVAGKGAGQMRGQTYTATDGN